MTIEKENLKEINQLKKDKSLTLRPISKEIENILFIPFEALDHGFIRVIDYMGNDSSIVQAARVSYGKGTKKISADKGLINYLISHQHNTPFEMCEIKFHIKLPIFVARQWIRHRTSSVNEYSARYSILKDEFYIPSQDNLFPQSKSNNQGKDNDSKLKEDESNNIIEILRNNSYSSYEEYLKIINQDKDGNILDKNRLGLTRELARINLPINCYTEWYWKVNLHNLLHFLQLRIDEHAQYEIRVYADIILNQIVKSWVPITYDAFLKHRLNSCRLSSQDLDVIKRLINGENVTEDNSGLTKREWIKIKKNLNL